MGDSSRNRVNRELASAAATWKAETKFKGVLILPVVVTHQAQVNLKGGRDKRTTLVRQCFERARADGYWVVDSSLADWTGSRTFEERRFKAGFPICLPQMAPLNTRRPPSARNSCSSQHRPASEAVSSARGDVRSTGGPVFPAFLRHRSTLGPFLRQSDCVACAARQPAGTGSAQILRNMSPNSRPVRCSSASRSQ